MLKWLLLSGGRTVNQKDGQSFETMYKSNATQFRLLFSSYKCFDINSSQKMEGVSAKNQFVWIFVASVNQVWKAFLSKCAVRAETVLDDYYSMEEKHF